MSSDKTILLITGANTGIGYQTVKQLLSSSEAYHILLGGRDSNKVEAAIESLGREHPTTNSTVQGVIVDLESDESIEKLAKDIEKIGRIDVLINNAGAEFDIQYPTLGLTPRQMFAKTFDINVTGTHFLTNALAPYLIKSSDPRLLFLTSGTASFAITEDPNFILNVAPAAGWPKKYFRELPAYKSSKMALNILMRDWERILKNDKVKVWCVNPGFVATDLGGDVEVLKKIGAGDPANSGRFVVSVVQGAHDGLVGKIASEAQADGIQQW